MRKALGLCLAGVLLTACTASEPNTQPTTTPAPASLITVVSAELITNMDPAAPSTYAGDLVAVNVFQRLMLVQPWSGQLKPDAAQDCLFRSEQEYECTLPRELTFSNGHRLTSADVKFSIERALRLAAPGSSLLRALVSIDTPDDQTIRFQLSWPDNQFGYALAAPAFSIVDEELYDPDALRPVTGMPVGSGPYSLQTFNVREAIFQKNRDYEGGTNPITPTIRLRYVKDSAAAEEAIMKGAGDVVWRSLTPAAITRIDSRIRAANNRNSSLGYTRYNIGGARVHQLRWNANSSARLVTDLRTAVETALRQDRTATSIVPSSISSHIDAFEAGGVVETRPVSGQLTLAYSSYAPGDADQARLIAAHIQNNSGITVILQPDQQATADLILSDRKAPVNTDIAWLDPYISTALPGSTDKVTFLEQRARTTTDKETRKLALSEVQSQAAADATVLPISEGDEVLFIASGVLIVGEAFGGGFQLGLWGFAK